MKSLFESLKDQFIYETIENINQEIITESIKATIIKNVAKQLLDQINNEKKQKENDTYKSIYNKNFKFIFGQSRIPWDKVDDKDIQKIEAQSWEDEKSLKSNEKLIRSILKGNLDGIIISQNPENEKFELVIFTWGNIYYLYSNYRKSAGDTTGSGDGRRYKDLTQREKIDLFTGKTLYFIDTKDFKEQVDKLRNERYNNKLGVINCDPDSLYQISRENIERYHKIIAKNKANNQNNDKLLDEAKELIDKISQVTVTIAKDPVSYSDLLYKVGELTKWVYDKRTYVAGRSARQPGYYSGVNGLIPLIAKYIESVKDARAGYSWGSKDIDSTITALKDTIAKCKKKLEEIEDLM